MLEKMKEMELNAPADIERLHTIEREWKITFPKQYVDFMKLHDGGEGPIGEYGYLAIWDIEELVWFNQSDEVRKVSGLIYFASDRGGTYFAFDMQNSSMRIVELYRDTVHFSETKVIADSLEVFIEYVYSTDDSELI